MDLIYFEQWARKEFNIDLSAYKSNQLHRRILSLISRVGAKSVDEYIQLLSKNTDQRQKFLDFITINVTEFFRNPEFFSELEKIMDKEKMFERKLNIWSAACSNGSEPYSIAMMLDSRSSALKHHIKATDIDSTVLSKAEAGEYVSTDVKNVKKEFISSYFKIKDEKYYVTQKIKNMVEFKKHDLILEKYEKDFDLIICRNVVIYFNQNIKNDIYRKFSRSLKHGGLLFVGATEGIYNYRDYGFEKVSTFIYRKIQEVEN